MFDNDSRIVRRSADTLAKLLGALGISLATGNTGTGMCQWGVSEHGCEYTPVAGRNHEFIEIPSAPLRFWRRIRNRRTVLESYVKATGKTVCNQEK